MKFNVSSKALYSTASAVSKIINSKNALTILNNFRLELRGDMLSIMAGDGENFLEGRLQVSDASGEGTVCVDARRLTDLLKELPDLGVSITVEPELNYAMTLEYSNGKFNFMGFNGMEFPLPEELNEDAVRYTFSAESAKLIRGIDNTVFAVGNDELRPQMMGILWDVKPDSLIFVATDTRKLVKFTDSSVQPGCEGSFILPLKSTVVFKNVFAKDQTVKVTLEEKGVKFESENYVFNSRFLKGTFPDYNRVIPQANPYELTVDRVSFQSSVRRIGAFCDAANGLVRFSIRPESLEMKASESTFNASAWESVPCQFTGEGMVIGFSAPYISEILGVINSEEVIVKLSDPSRPGVFVPAENKPDTELLMLLMPMLVTEF
ncbi:MAG: DNA polymerase III subunit beta [Bacteroidales bacterium]|nr:DNA polymerase III subunit beta [Bacteroidales bacterium]MBD5377124.1 DNA polymerase III subunit beta [Bacteroides sp.]